MKNLHSKELKDSVLLDSDVFLSYVKGGERAVHAEKLIKSMVDGTLKAFVSSMLYDDVMSDYAQRA